eukprot:403335771
MIKQLFTLSKFCSGKLNFCIPNTLVIGLLASFGVHSPIVAGAEVTVPHSFISAAGKLLNLAAYNLTLKVTQIKESLATALPMTNIMLKCSLFLAPIIQFIVGGISCYGGICIYQNHWQQIKKWLISRVEHYLSSL